MGRAQVFVTLGDLRHLECDAWLVPTDTPTHAGEGWHVDGLPEAAGRISPPTPLPRRWAFPAADWDLGRPLPVLTVIPMRGIAGMGDIRAALTAFVEAALPALRKRHATRLGRPRARSTAGPLPGVHGRSRPLLAIPSYGTGGGGGGSRVGQILSIILKTATELADRHGVDIALVLNNHRTFALAQVLRVRTGADAWPDLSPRLHEEARRLGGLARDNTLVPFLGAGVSASAGGPSWTGLIGKLARRIELDESIVRALTEPGRSTLDQAAYLREEFHARRADGSIAADLTFNELVADAVRLERYGLAPALLAGLKTPQAITLNYDTLFETASEDAGVPRTLLPQLRSRHPHWLLKLHGTVNEPASIVLTRDDYLGYAVGREALSAIVKATLITHHLLFVGFGLSDDHIHRIIHDVRLAVGDVAGEQRLATAVTLSTDPIDAKLWGRHVGITPMEEENETLDVPEAARRLEVFLDALLAHANDSHSYLLVDAYQAALTGPETELADAVGDFLAGLPAEARKADGWRVIARAITELGGSPDTSA